MRHTILSDTCTQNRKVTSTEKKIEHIYDVSLLGIISICQCMFEILDRSPDHNV